MIAQSSYVKPLLTLCLTALISLWARGAVAACVNPPS